MEIKVTLCKLCSFFVLCISLETLLIGHCPISRNKILFGSLSSPGDGIVRITLLTQVKKERKERLLSWVMAWCLVYWTPSLWVLDSMPGQKSFLSFFTCVSRVILTKQYVLISPSHVCRLSLHTEMHGKY